MRTHLHNLQGRCVHPLQRFGAQQWLAHQTCHLGTVHIFRECARREVLAQLGNAAGVPCVMLLPERLVKRVVDVRVQNLPLAGVSRGDVAHPHPGVILLHERTEVLAAVHGPQVKDNDSVEHVPVRWGDAHARQDGLAVPAERGN